MDSDDNLPAVPEKLSPRRERRMIDSYSESISSDDDTAMTELYCQIAIVLWLPFLKRPHVSGMLIQKKSKLLYIR